MVDDDNEPTVEPQTEEYTVEDATAEDVSDEKDSF